MLSIQITQSEGLNIYISCDGLKDEIKEGINKSYLTSFVLPTGGKWKGPLKRNEMDKNTDVHFLWGIKAQNFPLSSQMQSISTLIQFTPVEEIQNVNWPMYQNYCIILGCVLLNIKRCERELSYCNTYLCFLFIFFIPLLWCTLVFSARRFPALSKSFTVRDKHNLSPATDVSSTVTVNMAHISRMQ